MPKGLAKVFVYLKPRLNGFRARLKEASEARDSGDWSRAASIFCELWGGDRSREALLIQAGNCAKEAGDAPAALEFYVGVTQAEPRVETALQLGHFFKVTGNVAAAAVCYEWSAQNGNAFALAERQALPGPTACSARQTFFRGSESPLVQLEAEFISSILAAEMHPLDCARLARSAQAAMIEGLEREGAFFADLALVVGGPSKERRAWYDQVLRATGGLQPISPGVELSHETTASALSALVRASAETVDADDEPVAPRGAASKAWPGDRLIVLEPGKVDAGSELAGHAQALGRLRAVLFGGDESKLRAAIEAFVDVALGDGEGVFVSLPDARGIFSAGVAARRVALNCARALAERLDGTLRATAHRPSALTPLFWIPTGLATAATNDGEDRLAFDPSALSSPRGLADASAAFPLDADRIDDLLFEGAGGPVIPRARERAVLMRAARREQSEVIERWLDRLGVSDPASRDAHLMMELSILCKHAGDWAGARKLVERALRLRPNDVAFQIEYGILTKTLGDFAAASAMFKKVLARQPDHEAAARELAAVARETLDVTEIAEFARLSPLFGQLTSAMRRRDTIVETLAAPTVFPVAPQWSFGPERLEVLQVGSLKARIGEAEMPRLAGVVAIRARVVSAEAVVGLRVRLDGRTVDYVKPSLAGTDGAGLSMFYFNSWINTVDLPRGKTELQLYAELKSSGYSTFETLVLVDDPLPDEDYPESDSFVIGVPSAHGQDLVDAVGDLPSSVRESNRRAFVRPPKSILVVRLDQLGDLAASLAAMRRLSEMFPDAELEALVTPANEALVKSTHIFDSVTCVEFPYDHATRRRHLSRIDEAMLRNRYRTRTFDLAVDLSPGKDSRPVLKLVNAAFRAGFKPAEFDFLDFGVELITRDPLNRKHNISHTAMVNALVEAIGAAVAPPPERFAPPESSRFHLARYDLQPNAYVAIHSGARLQIKRWPIEDYVELAQLIRERTKRPVVFIADAALPAAAGEALRQDEGVTLFEGPMPFEVLDAVVGNARLFIGNDTGPKHLAAVRGVFTVSVHMGQVNWNEWGQDGEGVIVSRRVPCCGCGVEDVTECGKALACLTQIRPDAVADVVVDALKQIPGRDTRNQEPLLSVVG
jgi:ADP-heptose:LPS heptosyltransferase/tetratricopeptide (TPR) repeat protein